MSRDIDVKALVSHLVRGDGADKCRICMGETSEGQVFLGDTVMMDGERPVTLADLLEMVTGVEVLEDGYLPQGLCSVCTGSAVNAANFIGLCRKSEGRWNKMLQLLENLPTLDTVPVQGIKLYAFLDEDELTLKTVESVRTDPDTDNSPLVEMKGDVSPLSDGKSSRKKFKKFNCRCPDCGKSFICSEHLSQHLKYSSNYKRACHICAHIMPRSEMVRHMNLIHKIELFDCNKCPALFLSKEKYLNHIDADHANGACTCGECGRTFQSTHAYHAHQNMHIPKVCPGCNKVFRNERCYIHHVRTCCNLDKNREDTHKTKSRVSVKVTNKLSKQNVMVGLRGSAQTECFCDYCKKKFKGKKSLLAHIQIVHLKNTHRPCPYCGKDFPSAHMTTHIRTHEEKREFKCSHCNLVLKSKLGFSQHLRLHTGEKPYACQHCGETFNASSRRSDHIRKKHNTENRNKYACELCPARFAFPFRLRKHIANIHSDDNDDDSVWFKCPECEMEFKTCRGLLHHSRKHQLVVQQPPKEKNDSIKVFSKKEE